MLYEKASVLPPKGSLKEALFLTVWLKRQEAEVLKTRVMAQGIVDLAKHGAEATAKLFKIYVGAALPFLAKSSEASDQKMKSVMEREVKKGVIVFDAPSSNPLQQRAKVFQMDAETRTKLASRGKRIAEV